MEVIFFLFAIIALLIILLLYRNGRNRYNEYDMYDRDFDQSPYNYYTHQVPPQAPFPWNWWMGQIPPQMPMLPQHNPNLEAYKEYRRERNATDRMLGIVLGVVFGIGVLAIFLTGDFHNSGTTNRPIEFPKDTIFIDTTSTSNNAKVPKPSISPHEQQNGARSYPHFKNEDSTPCYIIRLGMFSNAENVTRIKDNFTKKFPQFHIEIEPIVGGERVSIGCFDSEKSANFFKKNWGKNEDWQVLKQY